MVVRQQVGVGLDEELGVGSVRPAGRGGRRRYAVRAVAHGRCAGAERIGRDGVSSNTRQRARAGGGRFQALLRQGVHHRAVVAGRDVGVGELVGGDVNAVGVGGDLVEVAEARAVAKRVADIGGVPSEHRVVAQRVRRLRHGYELGAGLRRGASAPSAAVRPRRRLPTTRQRRPGTRQAGPGQIRGKRGATWRDPDDRDWRHRACTYAVLRPCYTLVY